VTAEQDPIEFTPKNHADRWAHYLSRLAEAVGR